MRLRLGITGGQITGPTQAYVAVAFGTSSYAYSTDGENWSGRTLPVSGNWFSITTGNGMFVTIAENTTTVLTSTDGLSWTQRTLSGVTQSNWQNIVYGGGRFVATSYYSSNRTAHSTDTITWTQGSTPAGNTWGALSYGNGVFVAICRNKTTAASSTDGITWTVRTMPSSQSWRSSGTDQNNRFIAVAEYSTSAARSSNNGATWALTLSSLPQRAMGMAVAFGNNYFVTTASARAMLTDNNGATWQEATLPSGNWYALTYGGGKFVSFSNYDTKAVVSTDGLSWTQRTVPNLAYWSVAYRSFL